MSFVFIGNYDITSVPKSTDVMTEQAMTRAPASDSIQSVVALFVPRPVLMAILAGSLSRSAELRQVRFEWYRNALHGTANDNVEGRGVHTNIVLLLYVVHVYRCARCFWRWTRTRPRRTATRARYSRSSISSRSRWRRPEVYMYSSSCRKAFYC